MIKTERVSPHDVWPRREIEENPMSRITSLVPSGEAMRKAVKWVSEQGTWDLNVVEDSSRRFDLSPLEEEFLVRQFVQNRGIGA